MEEHAKEVAKVLKSLSNPNRLLILCALMEKEMSVNELHEIVNNISQPALSQHLAYLQDDGCIQSHKQGQQVFYSIKDNRLKELFKTIKNQYCK